MSAVPRAVLAALAAVLVTSAARAQGNPWFGEDALVLSRGMVRLGFAPTWTRFDQRYTVDGDVEPLAADLAGDTLGVSRLSILEPLQSRLPAVTGLSSARVTLGRVRADHDASILTVPFSTEVGIGGRLSLGAMVPIVRTRTTVLFSPNRGLDGGNVGINPALESEEARDQNTALLAQFAAAIQALEMLIESCADPGNPDPRCPEARTPEAQELVEGATAFVSGLGEVYSETGSLFVPIADSPLDTAIRARIASFAQGFADFDITDITSSGPRGARIAGLDDIMLVLTDSAFGIRAVPLRSRTSTNVGDIELGAKLQLVNTVRRDSRQRYGAGVRAAVGAVFRAGTGTSDDPDDFSDIPTGDGQHDVEARTYWDFLLGRRFAISFVGRYVWQLPDREVKRITPPHQIFVPYWRRHEVDRDLGDVIGGEVTSRISLGDFFSVMTQYRVRRKGEDRHTGTFNVTNELGDAVTLDASVLDQETEEREDRLSVGLGFSTVASAARGRSRIPLELVMQYGESIRGSGGKTPKVSVGVMGVRVWVF